MSRLLDDLAPEFKPLAMELIARCAEQGIAVLIVDTLRTEAEQTANIAKGVSWTKNSKHLPQPPSGKSLAIDIVPYSEFSLHGPDKLQWSSDDPVWETIAQIGEGLGLRSGHRWQQRDSGHFEYVKPLTQKI